jgi:hypothetical protein
VGFRIRGEKGGEPVVLAVADRQWAQKEDSLTVGDVGSFLPNGKLTNEWQVAWVPLKNFPITVDRQSLASLVFRILSDHHGKIFLKDLVFAKEKGKIPTAQPNLTPSSAIQNAMWLWETKQLYNNTEAQTTLADFCKEQHIQHLFMQIPYEATKTDDVWQVHWDFAPMQQLVNRLSQDGIAVTALDGDPHYALVENHGRVLTLIQSVIDYNKSSAPGSRMVGVRYDNEPYLLPQFGGVQKSNILQQYIDLLRKAKNVASAGQLELGVDVPFWFDTRNELGQWVATLGERPIIEPIIDIVDNIGVMDYRTVAYGADGVISNGNYELAYAAKRGKKVFVGLETGPLPDETFLDFQKHAAGQSKISAMEKFASY